MEINLSNFVNDEMVDFASQGGSTPVERWGEATDVHAGHSYCEKIQECQRRKRKTFSFLLLESLPLSLYFVRFFFCINSAGSRGPGLYTRWMVKPEYWAYFDIQDVAESQVEHNGNESDGSNSQSGWSACTFSCCIIHRPRPVFIDFDQWPSTRYFDRYPYASTSTGVQP